MAYAKNRLRMLREERGIEQYVVADALKISRSAMSQYENGMVPSSGNIVLLADFYHVSTDYLLGVSPERQPGGDLQKIFTRLAGLSGGVAPTISDMLDAANAALRYMEGGAPCGIQPIIAWRNLMQGLTACFTATAKNDVAGLMDSANAATLAALDITKMPANYLAGKKEGHG